MRLNQLTESKQNLLYEGLDHTNKRSVMLWESAGFKITEAAMTADQIQQLFKDVESGATASGSNRTAIGKGKDATLAVDKAWEDLKTKMQDSKPLENFDQKMSDLLSKIGMGAKDPKFNGEVSGWVQKYRDFAEKHPIAQGAIYATLLAVAGLTGAGLAGAAVLGLLKLADKVLQGERFTSAAYSGVKTAATAFAASKLGELLKGIKPGMKVPEVGSAKLPPGVPKLDFDKFDYYLGASNNVVRVAKGTANPFLSSYQPTGKHLSEGQVYLIINRITAQQLTEGPMWDKVKGAVGSAAGKAMSAAKTAGTNLTTKVTADKLNSAWKAAGSPMDSNAVADILKQSGVDDQIVGKVYTDLKLPAPGIASAENPQATPTDVKKAETGYSQTKALISKLNKKERRRLLVYMQKSMLSA
jgi:hypothetical protein